MSGLNRTAVECRGCPDEDTCQKKRMEKGGYFDLPSPNSLIPNPKPTLEQYLRENHDKGIKDFAMKVEIDPKGVMSVKIDACKEFIVADNLILGIEQRGQQG